MGESGLLSSNENARINSARTFLGSSMSIVDADLDDSSWSTTTDIDADPINAGVSNFTYVIPRRSLGEHRLSGRWTTELLLPMK